MKPKTYKTINKLFLVGLIIIIGISLFSQNTYLIFLGAGLYMVTLSLLKTRVRGILVDERQQSVSEKAAESSFKIVFPLLLLTSLALIMSAGSTEFTYLRSLGIILSYVTCVMAIIYGLTFWYFDKKTGGR